MIAVYPGSFDPLTLGHMDIIRRAARVADKLTVAVLENPAKTPMFSTQQRLAFLRNEIQDLPNVTADSFSGMLADYILRHGINLIIRGVRGCKDFEYESVMSAYNRALSAGAISGGTDTWFIPANPAMAHISGSAVREVAGLGGEALLPLLVPPMVKEELISRM